MTFKELMAGIKAREALEVRQYLQELLATTASHAQAARVAGVHRTHLYELLERYGVAAPVREAGFHFLANKAKAEAKALQRTACLKPGLRQ